MPYHSIYPQKAIMMMNLLIKKSKEPIFITILALTTCFLLFEISVFLRTNGFYLSQIATFSQRISIPWHIMPAVTFFIAVELLLHLAFCCLIYICVQLIISLIRIKKKKQFIFTVYFWVFSVICVLGTNQFYFPNSQFSFLGSFFPYSDSSLYKVQGGTAQTSNTQPNIIIIGVDSLRPDYLGYFGATQRTPFFDEFLGSATVFSEALTPLARTFPSWVSILTGMYPKENGARSNLVAQDRINFNASLAKRLQAHGYETIYATDETRFSNIDETFGFDKVIGPPMGVNDFLLGTINDFPISNLIVNTKLGRWLFPYSYANRAAFVTYDPNSFLNLLNSVLDKKSPKPLFMIVHFCLPHFPYLWSNLPGEQFNAFNRYPETIKRVDAQAGDLFAMLKAKHLLEHTAVIVLSDHGEALELPGDRLTDENLYVDQKVPEHFFPPNLQDEAMNQSAGHGTDVLGLPQYHMLLAFRFYGLGDQHPGIVPGLISTLDIKPTLLELLNLPKEKGEGISLLAAIKGQSKVQQDRDIFLESDYSPQSMRTVFPKVEQVLLDGIQLFKVDPSSNRLLVKPEMEKMIVQSKQFALVYKDWVLAVYPQSEHASIFILVNLVTGQWTDHLDSDFAQRSPAKRMLIHLNKFYGDEINQKISK